MAGYEQAITKKNVIQCMCVADADQLNDTFQEFAKNIEEAGYTPIDSIFYGSGGDLHQTKNIPFEIFVSVEENYHGKLPDNYTYHSYFQIRHLLSVRVKGMTNDDFNRGFNDLVQASTKLDDEEPNTGTFFSFKELDGEIYTDISVGLQSTEGMQ